MIHTFTKQVLSSTRHTPAGIYFLFLAWIQGKNRQKFQKTIRKKNKNLKDKGKIKKKIHVQFQIQVQSQKEFKVEKLKSKILSEDLTLFVLAGGGGWVSPLARKLRFVGGYQQDMKIKTRKKPPSIVLWFIWLSVTTFKLLIEWCNQVFPCNGWSLWMRKQNVRKKLVIGLWGLSFFGGQTHI